MYMIVQFLGPCWNISTSSSTSSWTCSREETLLPHLPIVITELSTIFISDRTSNYGWIKYCKGNNVYRKSCRIPLLLNLISGKICKNSIQISFCSLLFYQEEMTPWCLLKYVYSLVGQNYPTSRWGIFFSNLFAKFGYDTLNIRINMFVFLYVF